jgi:hypothetical protein
VNVPGNIKLAKIIVNKNLSVRQAEFLVKKEQVFGTLKKIKSFNKDTNIKLDDFKKIIKESISHYKLDSIVCLYDGAISVFYKDGNHHSIGSSIYSSNQMHEFNSDFYQIESIYYTFIH